MRVGPGDGAGVGGDATGMYMVDDNEVGGCWHWPFLFVSNTVSIV